MIDWLDLTAHITMSGLFWGILIIVILSVAIIFWKAIIGLFKRDSDPNPEYEEEQKQ
jgi:hypothetical protein